MASDNGMNAENERGVTHMTRTVPPGASPVQSGEPVVAAKRVAWADGIVGSRKAASRATWNTLRPYVLSLVAVGALGSGVFLVTQGGLYAVPLWLLSFIAGLFALVGLWRNFDRSRTLNAWLRETDVQRAIGGAEEARKAALLAPPWRQAAYYARRDELRRLPLPKESLRALRTQHTRCKDDASTLGGCCGPR